ncbi:MAG: transglycosylase SLT domain-containing protein [Hyphomicrobiaceae bacterium]|nr:transglycosylase SLT domain-containing protein [Hyphomicrobiaceae bacterium]
MRKPDAIMAVDSISISPALASIINRAGDKSGVDFDYLVQTAMRESSLNPNARAPTSSAVGLFQFIESTWLEVLKTQGPSLGYGQYAQYISQNADGDYVVANSAKRNEILALREDPQMSADLAAAFTRSNGEYLKARFGRQPSPGELYIAHFLGARGAEKMFRAGLSNPDQVAANLFPKQAQANRAIFFDHGRPKTIREVYRSLVALHNQSPATIAPQVQTAGFAGETEPLVPSRYGPGLPMDFTQLYSADPNGLANPQPAAQPAAAPRFVVVDPGAAFFAQLYNQ